MDQGMHSSRRSRTAGTVRRTTGSDFTASVAPSLAGWTATTGRHSGSSRQRINIYTVVSGRWARAGRQAAPGRGHQAVITRTQRLLLPSRSTPLLQLQRARSSIADSTRRQQARPQVSARFNSVHRSPCAMVGMDHPTFRNGGGGAPHLRPLVSRICICVSPEPRSMTHPVRVRVRPGACAQKAVKREPTLLLRKTSQKLLLCSPSFAGPACTAAAECGLLLL